jgi:hypothetical protein
MNVLLEVIPSAIATGIGITLANSVVNFCKHRNLVNDTSQVFKLLISNQLDDLYNMLEDCQEIKIKLNTRQQALIGPDNNQNIDCYDPSTTPEARKELLTEINRLKNRENTIRNDDLYKEKLNDIKLFKHTQLKYITKYFRKLKILLEDLKIFTSHELPNTIEDFDGFSWKSSEEYKSRVEFLIARIDITICLGLIAKIKLNSSDKEAQNDLRETFNRLNQFKDKIKNEQSILSLLKEDFEFIENYINQ